MLFFRRALPEQENITSDLSHEGWNSNKNLIKPGRKKGALFSVPMTQESLKGSVRQGHGAVSSRCHLGCHSPHLAVRCRHGLRAVRGAAGAAPSPVTISLHKKAGWKGCAPKQPGHTDHGGADSNPRCLLEPRAALGCFMTGSEGRRAAAAPPLLLAPVAGERQALKPVLGRPE